MSVINDVLKDLEQRRSQKGTLRKVHQVLVTDRVHSWQSIWYYAKPILAGLFFIVLSVFLWHHSFNRKTDRSPNQTTTVVHHVDHSRALQPGQFHKTFLKLTHSELASQAYQQGIQALHTGDKAGAIEAFKRSLEKQANFLPAVLSLSTLYYQQQHIEAAKQLLKAGLLNQPQSVTLRELLARIYIDHNQTKEALKILSAIEPKIDEHIDYYAVLAELYRDQNQPFQAAKIYRQLLSVRPNEGRFWTGLGIALQMVDQNHAALLAYQKADKDNQLPVAVRSYVEQQIQHLAG